MPSRIVSWSFIRVGSYQNTNASEAQYKRGRFAGGSEEELAVGCGDSMTSMSESSSLPRSG